jgi:hypothetical protein
MSTIKRFKGFGFRLKDIKYASSGHSGCSDGCECDDDGGNTNAHHSYVVCGQFENAVGNMIRNDPKARVYGIELEVPGSGTVPEDALRKLDKLGALRKEDGSLRYIDIEFNFPPLTAEYIKRAKIVTKVAGVMLQHADDPTHGAADSYGDSYSYGIHIHSNRGWMEERAAQTIVSFIRSNAAFFRWLSGRRGYSAYVSPHTLLDDRYAACLTYKNTIEYRMFRSTYDQREVNVWLSCIQAIEDWAHSLPETVLPELRGGTYSWQRELVFPEPAAVRIGKFFDFVRTSKGKYPGLKRAINWFEKQSDLYGSRADAGRTYDEFSLYSVIDSISPIRQRKVIERAQLPLPLAVAA